VKREQNENTTRQGTPQLLRAVDTAFDGLVPGGLDYIKRSSHVLLPQPLVAGFLNILVAQVPPHMMWDLSTIEFFGLVPVGAAFAEVPADFCCNVLVFNVLNNGRAQVNQAVADVNAFVFNGTDRLLDNVVDYADTPGHLIVSGGSTLTFQVQVIALAWVPPVLFSVGVRFGGREVGSDKWEDVAI